MNMYFKLTERCLIFPQILMNTTKSSTTTTAEITMNDSRGPIITATAKQTQVLTTNNSKCYNNLLVVLLAGDVHVLTPA